MQCAEAMLSCDKGYVGGQEQQHRQRFGTRLRVYAAQVTCPVRLGRVMFRRRRQLALHEVPERLIRRIGVLPISARSMGIGLSGER